MATEPPAEALTLREQHTELTRRQIVEATAALTRQAGHTRFTVPEVATRAGVSVRTVYRYFPKRQDLVDALASVADQVQAIPVPDSLEGLEAWLVSAWRSLLAEEALMRAQHQWPDGAQVRRVRVKRYRSLTDQLIASARPDLNADARDGLVDLTLLLTSSTAMFEFTDIIDVPVERGARLAAMAVRAAIEAA